MSAKIEMSKTAARALAERDVLKGQAKRPSNEFTNYRTFCTYSHRFDVLAAGAVKADLERQFKGARAAVAAFEKQFGIDGKGAVHGKPL